MSKIGQLVFEQQEILDEIQSLEVKEMNHIEMYEKELNESCDYEEKALLKQFYAMELEKANKILDKLKQIIDSKTNYFMNN